MACACKRSNALQVQEQGCALSSQGVRSPPAASGPISAASQFNGCCWWLLLQERSELLALQKAELDGLLERRSAAEAEFMEQYLSACEQVRWPG